MNDLTANTVAPYFTAAQQYSLLSSHYEDWSPIDWYQNVKDQGRAYSEFLHARGFDTNARIVDLTCGMGTQIIGLAAQGYETLGIDLAPGQIERARSESKNFDLQIQPKWEVLDALKASEVLQERYDVVLSCGNSVPLLGELSYIEQLVLSAKNLLSQRGVFISVLIDYTEIRKTQPYIIQQGPIANHQRNGIWIETGIWHSSAAYRSDVLFLYQGPTVKTMHYSFPRLYAILPEEYECLLRKVGFTQIEKRTRIDRDIPGFLCYIAGVQ